MAQAEVDGLLKELARSLVDEDAGATVEGESAEELLAQAHADEVADTELIVEAVPDEDITSDRDRGASEAATDTIAPTADVEVATGVQTMTLFDYMAAPPTARTGKGKKARPSAPSAQLLLFDLFAEQPEATVAAAAPAMPIQRRGLFTDTDEREEVA